MMKTQTAILMLFMFAAATFGALFTDVTDNHKWSDPFNWDTLAVPGGTEDALFGPDFSITGKYGLIDGGTWNTNTVVVGQYLNPNTLLKMTGGVLNTVGRLAVSSAPNSQGGVFELVNGTVNIGAKFQIGYHTSNPAANVYVKGGDIVAAGNLFFGKNGTLSITGGTVQAAGINHTSTDKFLGTVSMETGGTLLLSGNWYNFVNTRLDGRFVHSYGAAGSWQLDYDVTNPGFTTLKVVPEPATLGFIGIGALLLGRKRKGC